jgi:hypothetical protein
MMIGVSGVVYCIRSSPARPASATVAVIDRLTLERAVTIEWLSKISRGEQGDGGAFRRTFAIDFRAWAVDVIASAITDEDVLRCAAQDRSSPLPPSMIALPLPVCVRKSPSSPPIMRTEPARRRLSKVIWPLSP